LFPTPKISKEVFSHIVVTAQQILSPTNNIIFYLAARHHPLRPRAKLITTVEVHLEIGPQNLKKKDIVKLESLTS